MKRAQNIVSMYPEPGEQGLVYRVVSGVRDKKGELRIGEAVSLGLPDMESFLANNPHNVRVGVLPGKDVLLRHIRLPPIYEEHVDRLVGYEAHQQIPFPLDEVFWGFKSIPRKNSLGEHEVNIGVVQRTKLTEYFPFDGLDVLTLAPSVLPAVYSERLKSEKPIALLSVDINNTNLVICEDGFAHWTRSLASLSTKSQAYIVDELARSIAFWRGLYSKDVESALSTNKDRGFLDAVGNSMRLRISYADPYREVEMPAGAGEDNAFVYALAGLVSSQDALNLLEPKDTLARKVKRGVGKALVGVGGGIDGLSYPLHKAGSLFRNAGERLSYRRNS